MNERILVVEDEGLIAKNIERLLTNEGYEVIDSPPTAEGAIDCVERDTPDLVLMDIQLTGEMTGIEAAEKIYQEYGIPIVYLTAHTDEETVERAETTEPFGFLSKPIDEGELIATVRMAIRKSQKLTTERREYESKIHLSEEHYDRLVNTISDIVFEVDTEGYFQFISDSIRKYGYTPRELKGTHFKSIVHPEDEEKISRKDRLPELEGVETVEEGAPDLFDERRRGERSSELVVRLVHGNDQVDDNIYYFEVSSSGIHSETEDSDEPEFLGSVGVMRDITERKQRKKQLEIRNQAIEDAPVGIIIDEAGPDDTQIIYANEAYTELTGYSEDEVIGENCRFLQGEGTDEERVKEIRQAIENEEPVSVELKNYRKDGTEFWNDLTIAPVRAGNDMVTHYIGFQKDVTDRKQAEEALRESERRFREMSENIDVVYYNLEPDFSECHYVSSAYEDIWERDPSDVLDDVWSFTEAIVDEDRDRVVEQKKKLASQELSGDTLIQYRIRAPDGQLKWIEDDMFGVWENGELVRIVGYAREITRRKEYQQELLESEERFRQLAGNINSVFWLTDSEKDEMIYVSPAYESIWGRSVESLYEDPTNFLDAVHPEDRDRVEESIPYQQEQNYEIRYRIEQPDGEVRWIRDRANPIEDENGEVYRVAGIAEDITEQVEREQHLERYRAFLDEAHDIVTVMDEYGTIEYINPAVERVLGYSPSELEGTDGFDAIHPDDRDRVIESFSNLLEDPSESTRVQARYLTSEGEVRWLESDGVNKFNNPAIDGIVAISRDITANKKIERERKQFVELVEHSPNFIVKATLDEQLTYVNNAGQNMLGLDEPDDVLGESILNIFPEDIQDKIDNKLNSLSKEDVWMGESEILNQNSGHTTKTLMNAFMISDPVSGEPIRYAVIATDLSDQIEVENQLRDMVKEKDILLQEVHHRVKNNMQIISSMIGLEKRQIEDKKLQVKLTKNQNRIRSMKLIHQHLYSQGKVSDIDVESYFKQLVRQIISTYESGEISINYDIKVEPIDLSLDESMYCGLILQELISNSIEHAFEGMDQGELDVSFTKESDQSVRLVYEDDGVGLPVDHDLDKTSSVGMKLIDRLAARQLDGQYEYENTGEGTRFEFSFPISRPDKEDGSD